MNVLPDCEHLRLQRRGLALHITLNRPKVRNALSFAMAAELDQVFATVRSTPQEVRAVVLRGAGGHFCAGGDIKEMAALRQTKPDANGDPIAAANRRFGSLLEHIATAPQVVVSLLEGSVMGGGFGLACVSDVSVSRGDVAFRLPETRLGLVPAQILPFVLRRLGQGPTRRLALTADQISAREAHGLGLVAEVVEDEEAMQRALERILAGVAKCGPHANAATKRLLAATANCPVEDALDEGSLLFAHALRSDEAAAGATAFMTKSPAPWSSRP